MNFILFDGRTRDHLVPLTLTRPVADLRIGIFTLREKWEFYLKSTSSTLTLPYLQEKYPCRETNDNLFINGSVIPTQLLADTIRSLPVGHLLRYEDEIIAIRLDQDELKNFTKKYHSSNSYNNLSDLIQTYPQSIYNKEKITIINRLPDIYELNKQELLHDFTLKTEGRKSEEISQNNTIIGDKSAIFIEQGVTLEGVTLNTQKGPIYIGKDAEIMEGSCLRGPLAVGEHAVIKMGSKIYEDTTIGPYCKVGGEISNSVFFGYSNKAHDGYLGNSVIGEWCNLGAGTNSSNLQNNYKTVPQWHYPSQKAIDTKRQFCGLVIGDYSRCGINTMFNTGTVVGVCCNLFGAGFHAKFIPSFSFGNSENGYSENLFPKIIETAETVYSRRNLTFGNLEKEILYHLSKNKGEDLF